MKDKYRKIVTASVFKSWTEQIIKVECSKRSLGSNDYATHRVCIDGIDFNGALSRAVSIRLARAATHSFVLPEQTNRSRHTNTSNDV